MYFTIATDQKRITIAHDGQLYGRSCLAIEDEGGYDFKAGIGVAMMNMYLALPGRPTFSLAGFPEYCLIFVEPGYMLEFTTLAVQALTKYRRPVVAEAWGKKLKIEIVSIAPMLEEIEKDRQKIDNWSWYVAHDPKDIH